ncbi:MAG: monoheme cytochrome C [Flavobacteriales bacterium]|nr:monoheme cytochrome C [Flavobacteriia bacterium]NCP53118.1 monoheme cytochrome C [Flavobacteriales bacterium]PIV94720.1 MAG: monoheme cytochrome C [Flavobacteriaceae bacterium CG17_big_fil_post_rev_8_21_14_2_50_33_15]PJB16678.1 MAG: monoheme cytochrome C [Flavobacteriaceae bacterium CG_4_9_14_3_um_filter_33_16]NCQ13329.1 monoheme cytochrome C [Flavobacteriales bacterium]
MSEKLDFHNQVKKVYRFLLVLFSLFVITGGLLIYYMANPSFFSFKEKQEIIATVEALDPDRIENGIHVSTGFVDAEGLMTVVRNCTNCHSSKLVLQNRMNVERWNATIKWMQETQNLPDLGKNQEIIVNYLATNYPPIDKGRREILSNIDWYVLKD